MALRDLCLAIVLGFMGLTLSCGQPAPNAFQKADTTATAQKKLFPPAEACNYPTNSSIVRYRGLGGGVWSYHHYEVSNNDYDCGEPEKALEWNYADGGINVNYGVVGLKDGAEAVGYDYDVWTYSTIPEEPKLRQDFVTLVDETLHQALKGGLPDNIKKQMMDLNSFGSPGSGKASRFDVGDGRVVVDCGMAPTGKSWLIRVQICSFKESKECN